MSHHELGYEAHLRQHGYRLTPQREIILDAVCAAGTHTSFDEIRARVQEQSPVIDHSTIYRALDFLAEQGIVLRADLGHGHILYEIAHTDPHHHLVCQRCGSVADLSKNIVLDFFGRVQREHDFEAHMDHLVVRGLCKMCAQVDAEDEYANGGYMLPGAYQARRRMSPMEQTKPPPDMEDVVAFHGHFCPGITIGYRAAQIALRRLEVDRAKDEELVAICETDACGLDAIQVVTGCTMGKGNLILRDWGKQVFSIGRRGDSKMLRIALRYGLVPEVEGQTPDERRQIMLDRLTNGSDEELYDIRWIDVPFPETARIFKSVRCVQCGEGVMEPHARIRDGQPICPECFGKPYSRFLT